MITGVRFKSSDKDMKEYVGPEVYLKGEDAVDISDVAGYLSDLNSNKKDLKRYKDAVNSISRYMKFGYNNYDCEIKDASAYIDSYTRSRNM